MRCAPTSSATAWRSCTSTWRSSTACSAAASSQAARAWCGSAGATTSAIPTSGLRTPCAMLLERRTGSAPAGPIRLLTHLRTFGHCFNPVSFYYCFTPQEQLDAVVAEVTNTPWGERHAYVLDAQRRRRRCWPPASRRRCTCPRSWGWSSATPCARAAPGATLAVHIESQERGAARVRRDARAASRAADAAAVWLASPRATRRRRCACSRSSTATRSR